MVFFILFLKSTMKCINYKSQAPSNLFVNTIKQNLQKIHADRYARNSQWLIFKMLVKQGEFA